MDLTPGDSLELLASKRSNICFRKRNEPLLSLCHDFLPLLLCCRLFLVKGVGSHHHHVPCMEASATMYMQFPIFHVIHPFFCCVLLSCRSVKPSTIFSLSLPLSFLHPNFLVATIFSISSLLIIWPLFGSHDIFQIYDRYHNLPDIKTELISRSIKDCNLPKYSLKERVSNVFFPYRPTKVFSLVWLTCRLPLSCHLPFSCHLSPAILTPSITCHSHVTVPYH